MNENVKKPLEKSTNVLEGKRQMVKQKNLHKKEQSVYNNCYDHSRAIKHHEKDNKSLSSRSAAINKIQITHTKNTRNITVRLPENICR